jgi:Na+-driven multidrug efflux pump
VSPYLYLITSVVFIIAAFASILLFRKAIPNNSFFRNQTVYRYYYLYVFLVAVTQLIISFGYVIGSVNCNQSQPDPILNISMSIANCLILVRSLLLCILRYSHPAVKIYFQNIFKKQRKSDDIDPLEELNSHQP